RHSEGAPGRLRGGLPQLRPVPVHVRGVVSSQLSVVSEGKALSAFTDNCEAEGRFMAISLPVVNLAEATFECIYGRGCDGICCRNGRPPVFAEDDKRIRKHLARIRPLMRPEAQ